MKHLLYYLIILTAFSLISCNSSKQTIIPLSKTLQLHDTYTINWNGISKAYRYKNGEWLRAETYDYLFTVVQKRYDNRWKSIKTLHRVHPEYDGKAGDRNQTMYFEVAYQNLNQGEVQAVINSSLGDGTGTSDTEFRRSELTIHVADAGIFTPYNKIKITQHYKYEEGLLTETVELIKEKDGRDIPFMKNEETAMIYIKSKLKSAPTTFN